MGDQYDKLQKRVSRPLIEGDPSRGTEARLPGDAAAGDWKVPVSTDTAALKMSTHRCRIICRSGVNPLAAKLFNLNFHPLEVVSRWRDPQFQVSEN